MNFIIWFSMRILVTTAILVPVVLGIESVLLSGAEEIVWDELNGYEGYDQAFQNEPYRSLDYFASGGLYQYGSTIWNLYIHENFGDSAVKNMGNTHKWNCFCYE